VCRETARHVKVALSGLGGDELFGGYERYVGLQMGELFQKIPRPIRLAMTKLGRSFPNGNGSSYLSDRLQRFLAANELSTEDRYRSFIVAFRDVKEILHPDFCDMLAHRTALYKRIVDQFTVDEPLDLGLFTDLYLYLPDDLLPLTDRISMAHSLEVRVPFLDHQLLEFVARLPAKFKVHGFRKKVIFRRTVATWLAPWLPPGHLKRPKQGFSVPLDSWLKGPLRPLLSDLIGSRRWRESSWLNHSVIRKLVDEHLTGQANHEVRLWAILCFQEWERQYGGS
jgi:asparagine synthase (glutamine-hydrolysing)